MKNYPTCKDLKFEGRSKITAYHKIKVAPLGYVPYFGFAGIAFVPHWAQMDNPLYAEKVCMLIFFV